MTGYTRLAVIGALVAFGLIGLAAAMVVSNDTRLADLFTMFGTIVAALIALLRADTAASHAANTADTTTKIAKALNGLMSSDPAGGTTSFEQAKAEAEKRHA